MNNSMHHFPFANREPSSDSTPRNIRIGKRTINTIQHQLDMIRERAQPSLGETALKTPHNDKPTDAN